MYAEIYVLWGNLNLNEIYKLHTTCGKIQKARKARYNV